MERNDIHSIFYEEVRDKKRTASGVHHKTGKRGYVGKMLFPSDIMSRGDKYRHRKASKVVTTNIYEQIIPKSEFDKLEDYEKRNMMQYWRNTYKAADIRKGLQVASGTYYEMLKELDLPIAKRGGYTRKAKVEPTPAAPATTAAPAAKNSPVIAEPVVNEIIVDGIHFAYSGTYSPEHIQNQLLKFATLLENEPDKFYIELKLMQKPNKD